MEDSNPRKVIIKTMTANRSIDDVFDFFTDTKSMEIGGAAKSVAKGSDGWWTFDHVAVGESKMKHLPVRQAGVLDHVYVRIIPNQGGSTVIWAFVRPDSLTDEQFENQLQMFDREIELWKGALEAKK
jgi:hypothetical protein